MLDSILSETDKHFTINTSAKKFVIFWHASTYGENAWCREVDSDFFTENNGFDANDIEAINNLDVGQMYICDSIADDCRVIRLKGDTYE